MLQLARLGAASVMCMGAVIATGTPAESRPVHHWMYTNDAGDKGGRVDFWPIMDEVKFCDTQADGARVELKVWNVSKDPDQKEYTRSIGGKGECFVRFGEEGQPYNLEENACIRFRIRLVKNGREVDGSQDSAQWRNYNDANAKCEGVR